MMMSILMFAAAASSAPVQVEPPGIVAEARAFMQAYEQDLARRDGAAVAARYARDGAYFLGCGHKTLVPKAALVTQYTTKWPGPAAFAWKDLSIEALGADAALVAGRFEWTSDDKSARTYSYSSVLVREDGALRIRLEDESGDCAKPG
ncbi:nuclear transport factor 2 family protein [Lysobacter xanthus]